MARREAEHSQLPIPNGWFAVEFSRELREGCAFRTNVNTQIGRS